MTTSPVAFSQRHMSNMLVNNLTGKRTTTIMLNRTPTNGNNTKKVMKREKEKSGHMNIESSLT